MNLTTDDIRWIVIRVFVLLISVAIHEFGHAIMADFLGDDTPDENGFEAVNDAGGISIRVKPPTHTTARYGLGGVAETLAWLRGQL